MTASRTAEIAKAREVDTRIAAAWNLAYDKRETAQEIERRAAQAGKVYFHDTPARAAEKAARAAEIKAEAVPVWAEASELSAAAIRLDRAEYEGWSRFFLVKHIHNTTACSSFRPSTRVGWLPNVSGLTEAEAVAENGETLCTKCFPSAPVALTTKAADPSLCAGSNQPVDYSKPTGRERAYYSPTGTCATCGAVVGLTARGSGKARKHKA